VSHDAADAKLSRYRVAPGATVHLKDYDPDDTGGLKHGDDAVERTAKLKDRLEELQERLYAESTRAVLVVLQGIDTSGKDGTIRHVMGGLNPQGCVVASFKAPTPLEREHDFLWRVHAVCPPHGYIGVFNRSHYEDVLVTRVHGQITDKEAKRRFDQIREFEELLTESGTQVLKFFLHISKEEQQERLLARIDHPDKRWKVNPLDVKERALWKEYAHAFEDAMAATSTAAAPWFVVPANHKWYRNMVVADRLVNALEEMDPRPPEPPGIDWAKLRKELAAS
jgi:PPK2 family polyphosphate:nucleotide phosphotransferase